MTHANFSILALVDTRRNGAILAAVENTVDDTAKNTLETAIPMRPWRVRFVLFIAAVIVAGHLFDIYSQRESWPFSNYPMYAKMIRKNQTSLLRVYGMVTDGQKVWEMPIVADNTYAYVPPLNELRMKNILDYVYSNGGERAARRLGPSASPAERTYAVRVGGAQALRPVLRDYMAMYEERRVLGQHGTPEQGPQMLQAICKRLTWKLDAKGNTIDKPKEERIAAVTAFPVPEQFSALRVAEPSPTSQPTEIDVEETAP